MLCLVLCPVCVCGAQEEREIEQTNKRFSQEVRSAMKQVAVQVRGDWSSVRVTSTDGYRAPDERLCLTSSLYDRFVRVASTGGSRLRVSHAQGIDLSPYSNKGTGGTWAGRAVSLLDQWWEQAISVRWGGVELRGEECEVGTSGELEM
eukprot:1150583-Pelagomonas_calceolata.AAC.5